MLIRGASLDLIIYSNRFYLGILFVSSILLLNPKLQLKTWHLVMLSFMSIYEFLSLNWWRTNPLFYQFLSWDSSFILGRSYLGGGIYRAIGPALNSSISGSIYAIFFWFFLKNRGFKLKNSKDYFVATILFVAFLFCGSATSIITFIILGALLFILKSEYHKNLKITHKLISQLFILSFIFLILGFIFFDFLKKFQQNKLSYEYLNFIFDLKMQQGEWRVGNFWSLLFGGNLSEVSTLSIGGDFILLSTIAINGLIPVLFLCAYIYHTTPKQNRAFLMAAMISSMHYGTLFSLTGQILFAALMTNRTNFEENLLPRVRLKLLNIQL